MKVLVACEFSGVVRDAFARAGHIAFSCDLLPTESESPCHYVRDVREILNLNWDLMIAHPPCTYLSLSGNRWRSRAGRPRKVLAALDFAVTLWESPIPRIALEQPRSILGSVIGKRTQEVHPYEFGIPEFKATWLWLKNVPPLRPTQLLDPPKLGTKKHDEWSVVHRVALGPERQQERSLTYPEIAQAMVEQWAA